MAGCCEDRKCQESCLLHWMVCDCQRGLGPKQAEDLAEQVIQHKERKEMKRFVAKEWRSDRVRLELHLVVGLLSVVGLGQE